MIVGSVRRLPSASSGGTTTPAGWRARGSLGVSSSFSSKSSWTRGASSAAPSAHAVEVARLERTLDDGGRSVLGSERARIRSATRRQMDDDAMKQKHPRTGEWRRLKKPRNLTDAEVEGYRRVADNEEVRLLRILAAQAPCLDKAACASLALSEVGDALRTLRLGLGDIFVSREALASEHAARAAFGASAANASAVLLNRDGRENTSKEDNEEEEKGTDGAGGVARAKDDDEGAGEDDDPNGEGSTTGAGTAQRRGRSGKGGATPPMLPARSPSLRYPSCAVVGNAGSLLRRRHGDAIDAHAAQFRLNQAPTVGFAPHVGRKTTLRLLNAAWTREYGRSADAASTNAAGSIVPGAPGRLRAALEPGSTLVATRSRPEKFAQLWRALEREGRLAGTARRPGSSVGVVPDGDRDVGVSALLLSDAAVTLTRHMLERLRLARLRGAAVGGSRAALAGRGGSAPSTGALAIAVAVSGVCAGPVRLYGFSGEVARDASESARKAGGGRSGPYHYFSQSDVWPDNPDQKAHPHHSYPLEADLVEVLVALGAVTEVVL